MNVSKLRYFTWNAVCTWGCFWGNRGFAIVKCKAPGKIDGMQRYAAELKFNVFRIFDLRNRENVFSERKKVRCQRLWVGRSSLGGSLFWIRTCYNKFESNDKSLPSKITIPSELSLLNKNCVVIVTVLFENRKTYN